MCVGRWNDLSLLDKPVFLQAAVGFFGDGAFGQVGVEGRVKIVFTEGRAVGKAEDAHAVEGAEGAVFQGFEQCFDLVADLVACCLASMGFFESIKHGGEEEFNELGGVGDLIAGREGVVVFLLPLADDVFHRKVGERGFPLAEDEGLPGMR